MATEFERILLRRKTDAQWVSSGDVLASGEPGYATDTHVFKIGNGVDQWGALGVAGFSVSWSAVTGKPAVIAAGTTQAAARSAIGAAAVTDLDNFYTKSAVDAIIASLNGGPVVEPTVTLTTSAITASTITLNWTIDPGTYEVDGVFPGRDPVGALPAYEAATIIPGLTGSVTFDKLPSGTPVTMYVKPIITSQTGARVDLTASTTSVSNPPANTTLPTLDGLAQVGQTLTVVQGTWTNGPTGYAHQWLSDGVNIAGATGTTYLISSGQVGKVISCVETASNASGSTSVTTVGSDPVVAAPTNPPVNTVVPTITGTVKVGVTLTSTGGTWTNSPSLARQWQTQNAGTSTWVDLPGATATTYMPVDSDAGDLLRVRVIGTNAAGSATAFSASVGPVAPVTTGFPVPTGYNLFYGRDFTVANATDDANWAAYTGTQANNNAQFRTQNVIKSGANGQELIAQRAAGATTIYSGAVKNFAIRLPQYFYLRAVVKLMHFSHGSWPSLWSRPQSGAGDGEGEIDYVECFGGHIGGSLPKIMKNTIILTPYGGTQTNVDNSDWGMPAATYYGSAGVYGAPMTVEIRKVPNSMSVTVNGVAKGTINRPSAQGAKWDAQMEDPAKRWYVRLDHQAGGTQGQAGNPDGTGAWEARQSMTELVIGVPS